MTLRRGRNPDAGVRHEPESRGDWGENTAADFLKRSGWKIEAVRHRVDRRNELDIVAWDGDTLVFVEVKTRRSERFGRPVESVHRAKRFHLSRAAVRYLSKRRAQPRYIRFDVMEVVGEPDNFRMEHLRNVFPLSTPYRPPPLLDRD
ncbi:MAG: YraN family protein [Kiritimatiellae bacterium]|nr:YraN family protein [Kiritimatiellia bacterium]